MALLPEPMLATALPRDLGDVQVRVAAPIHPSYLTVRDYPWLSALIEEYQRFAGRRSADLAARLKEPLRVSCPMARLSIAQHVMDRICKPTVSAAIAPQRVREAVFTAAASRADGRDVLEEVARQLGHPAGALFSCLFADLPTEKLQTAPPPELHAAELALRVNLALVQGLLGRATALRIAVWGNARDIVRQAQLSGLLCLVTSTSIADEASTRSPKFVPGYASRVSAANLVRGWGPDGFALTTSHISCAGGSGVISSRDE